MHIHKSTLALFGFAVLLGFGPAPAAGAQTVDTTPPAVVRADGPVVPAPCPDCDQHNAQPGSGPGIFRAAHACEVTTGRGIGIYSLGNPNKTAVTYNFDSVSSTGLVEGHYSGTIPAGAGVYKSGVSAVLLQIADVDLNGSIHLVGTLAGRPLNQTFACPCAPPVTSPPSSVPPTAPATTIPGTPTTPPASVPGITTQRFELPATGAPVWPLIGIAAGAVFLGALLWFAAWVSRPED